MTNQEFEIFVEHTRPKLLAIAHQYLSVTADAEDVVQEALLKLYAMRQRLDTYHSVDALAVVAVKHLALNVLRHEQRHHETTLDERVTSYEEPPSEERYMNYFAPLTLFPTSSR
jgi:DNA-directed RNA polymerase specialized sigma24 family protein